MPGDFAQVVQKMARANHHATVLHQELTAYIDRQPYVTFVEDKPEIESYQVTTKLHEPPPSNLALITGDFLTNAHGALDYLAWQLVLREGKRPGGRTIFPIMLPNEDGTLPEPQIVDSKERPAIADPEVLKALDAVQPYQNGPDARNHPLYILKVLNRETKHRHLPLLAMVVPAFAVGGGFVDLPKQMPVFGTKRLKDEQEVQVLPYNAPPNPRVPEDIKLAVEVAIERVEQAEEQPLGAVVAAVHNLIVEDVLPRFQPFF